jgi:zinc transport system permease protein
LGDGLSHTAFGALAIATVLDISNQLIVVLPVTALLAVFLLKRGQKTKVRGDAALAMVSVGALAIGYMLLNIFPGSKNVSGDVCGTLFGATSILTLTKTDVTLCAFLAAAVILLFVVFYNKIFAVTFDESFAESTGIKTQKYNTVIALVTAVIIVIAMNLVGSLLISALIVFPALSAMRVFKSFKGTVICAAAVAALSAAAGIVLSVLTSTPVGPAIVVMNILFKKHIKISLMQYYKGLLKGIVPCVALTVLSGGLFKLINLQGWLGFLVNVGFVVIVFVISMRLFGMNEYEKNLISGMLNKLFSKFKKHSA